MADGGDDTSMSTTSQNLPSYISDASKKLVTGGLDALTQPYQTYQGPRVAPMTDAQTQAYDFTADTLGTRGAAYRNATQAATGLTGYDPSNVSAQQISGMPTVSAERISAPTPVGFDRVNAPDALEWDRIDPSQAGQVNLRQMTQADNIAAKLFPELAQNIDAYMSPYISSALNPTLREMATQNDALQNQINAQAAAGGAFGGSRHGIVNAEQNRNYGQAVGDVTAKAYQDAFERARTSIFQDIANTLQADTSNQQMQQRTREQNLAAGLSTDQFNAGNVMKALLANQAAGLQANQWTADAGLRAALANQAAGVQTGVANMDAALRAALANQSTGLAAQTTNLDAALRAAIANQGADLTAQTSNQNAGLQGAALNLNAAKALEDMGYRNQQMQLQNARDLFTMGSAEQALGQKNLDTAYADFTRQNDYGFDQLTKFANLLKTAPSDVTKTSVTDPADPNYWTQILGGAATIAGLGGKNGFGWW